jgi:hypothetical protein
MQQYQIIDELEIDFRAEIHQALLSHFSLLTEFNSKIACQRQQSFKVGEFQT